MVNNTFSLENGVCKTIDNQHKFRQIDKELKESLNSSFDEIWVTDGEGNTLAISKAAEQLYGVKTEEIIGKNVRELVKNGLFFPSITLQAIEQKKYVVSVQVTRRNRKLLVAANPIFDENNKLVKVINYNWDITELSSLKKRLAEAERLIDTYRKEIFKLRCDEVGLDKLVVSSSAMNKIIDIVNKVAMVDSNVLIQGDSGVGKGMIAKRIHKLSGRHNGPFITIDCGAIPETLIESELFGYEGGAFTGAKKEGKKGLIELGNGGTVFFDEIGELPINLQAKLLWVIQEKRLMRIGGNKFLDINIRVLAATNRDLSELIKQRKFREDLYYRLNVVPILVPPLRNRIEEIKMLTNYFTSKINERYGFHKQLSPKTINILEKYHWPGNVRELENLVERLLVITDANEILPNHLPEFLFQTTSTSAKKVTVWDICSLKEATDEVEKQLLRKVQEKCKNTYQMAEVLKVNQSTIVRKLHKYGLLGK